MKTKKNAEKPRQKTKNAQEKTKKRATKIT